MSFTQLRISKKSVGDRFKYHNLIRFGTSLYLIIKLLTSETGFDMIPPVIPLKLITEPSPCTADINMSTIPIFYGQPHMASWLSAHEMVGKPII